MSYLDEIKNGLYVLMALVTLGAYVYTWVSARSKANASTIAKLDERLNKVDKRVAVLEADIRHLPQDDDMHRLHGRLDDVSRRLAETCGKLDGVMHQMHIISEHLINKKA